MSAKFSIDSGRYLWFWMPSAEWREVGFHLGEQVRVAKEHANSFAMTRLTPEEYRRLTGGKSRQRGFVTLRRFPGHSDAWGFSTSALNFGVGPVGATEIDIAADAAVGIISATLPRAVLRLSAKIGTEEEATAPEAANGPVNSDMIQNLAEALSVVNAAINGGYATPGIEDGVITLTVQQVLRG